jgi:ectoine hydroxylase-related dioxygenase (phytanoyl-CoA dioxygenase family)
MLKRMEPHPDNQDFSWTRPEGPFEFLSAEQVRAYDELGGFVLEAAFEPDEVQAVMAAIDPLEAEADAALAAAGRQNYSIARAGEIVFSAHLVARSEVLKRFSRHAVFKRLTRELIGPDVRLYWDQLVYKKPGTADEFPWHQDNGYTFVRPQQYLTCWVALTDATVANGCPWIVPGAHRQGTLAHRWTDLGFECLREPEGAVPLEVSAGAIAVFSSLTPHRTGPNLTDGARKSYILQYAPAGAVMYPRGAEPRAADDPNWQYAILESGESVEGGSKTER